MVKPRFMPGLFFLCLRLGASCGEVLKLPKVVDVVAGHGFDDGPEGHRAPLGVGGGAVAVVLRDGGEEEQVPVARGVEESEGWFEVVDGVALGPCFLVEGLDDRGGFAGCGEGLAEAKGEDHLGVGEVGDDVADAPFAGLGRSVGFGGGEAAGEGVDTLGGAGEDWDGVAAVQVFGVGV
jgi:hypothetical protein